MNITKAITSIQQLLNDIRNSFSEDEYLDMLGRVQAIDHLLENLLRLKDGIDVNTKDTYGVTPLMWAAKGGCLEIAEFLIRQGADVNADMDSDQGENALTMACNGGSDASPSSEGHTNIVRLLIENGLNLKSEEYAVVALMYALEYGGVELAQLLLGKGVNVNVKDGTLKRTALIYTMARCREDVVRYLINNGADVNAEDCTGTTALHQAVSEEREDIVKLLLEKGASVDATARRLAMNAKNKGIEILLKVAADKRPERAI